jgi:hypothetical protein
MKSEAKLVTRRIVLLTMRAVFGMGHRPTSQPAQYV